MSDGIRQLLRAAAPDHEPQPEFDRLWDRARRQRRSGQLGGAAAGVILLVAVAAGLTELAQPTRSVEVTSAPEACPVTIPDADFVPPPGYPEEPDLEGDSAWYGTPELWTVLDVDGDYHGPRKSVWWSENFQGGSVESEPNITVTWERLDDPEARPITRSRGTNAYTAQDGWFMIGGIDPDIEGCWKVTASYRGTQLAYVYYHPGPGATPTE